MQGAVLASPFLASFIHVPCFCLCLVSVPPSIFILCRYHHSPSLHFLLGLRQPSLPSVLASLWTQTCLHSGPHGPRYPLLSNGSHPAWTKPSSSPLAWRLSQGGSGRPEPSPPADPRPWRRNSSGPSVPRSHWEFAMLLTASSQNESPP